jgi:hypothetical protein
MTMMFVGLRPKMIGSWLRYEMWNIRSVNRLYVDNLGPPGIGETLPKFW